MASSPSEKPGEKFIRVLLNGVWKHNLSCHTHLAPQEKVCHRIIAALAPTALCSAELHKPAVVLVRAMPLRPINMCMCCTVQGGPHEAQFLLG